MGIKNNLIKVGEYNSKFNEILKLNLDEQFIFMSAEGLEKHMIKRNHSSCLKYINYISDILNTPDFIGINPNEETISFEVIKIFDENVLVGVKLDVDENYLYVSTIHEIQQSKLNRRLYSGRLKKY